MFLGLSLIGLVPAWLATGLTMVMASLGDESSAALVVFGFVQAGVSALSFGWIQAGIAYYSVRTLRAESPTVGETVVQALRRVSDVVVAYTLATLAATVGFFLLVVPGVVLWLMFWVAAPVAAVEGGMVSALRRSHQLTNGHKWRLLGVLAMLLLVLFVLILGFAGAFALVASASPLVALGGLGLMQILIWAVWGVVSAASYYHLRVVAEGDPRLQPDTAA